MKEGLKKLFLLIASSDITKSQLRDFIDWIDMNGAFALEEVIIKIRSAAEDSIMGNIIIDNNIKSSKYRNYNINRNESKMLPEQIDRLLRLEAGLTVSEAKEKLINLLVENYNFDYNSLPCMAKRSFRDWIEQLSRFISYSKLLHIATKIRNELVHDLRSDWPLKNS